MNKEEFRLKVKKWFMDYFQLDEEKASEELKYYEDYITNAIADIDGGADEKIEYNNLKYIISIA